MALAIDCALLKVVVGICEEGGGGCKTGAAYKRAKEKGGQEQHKPTWLCKCQQQQQHLVWGSSSSRSGVGEDGGLRGGVDVDVAAMWNVVVAGVMAMV